MSTRAGGSSSLINRSMYEFSLTFTVVDQKYQFEHCIGKTIQRVSQSMDCVREFFFFFNLKVSHAQNTDKNM